MRRMSSPGMYARCSAKSSDRPRYGKRCRPLMKPSTTVLATSSRSSMRWSTAGSTKRAPGSARDMVTSAHPRCGRAHRIQQPVDHRVWRDPLRLRVEIEQHPVAQDRVRECPYVLERDVRATRSEEHTSELQ